MTRGHDGSAESLAKQRAREVPVPPPGGDGDDRDGWDVDVSGHPTPWPCADARVHEAVPVDGHHTSGHVTQPEDHGHREPCVCGTMQGRCPCGEPRCYRCDPVDTSDCDRPARPQGGRETVRTPYTPSPIPPPGHTGGRLPWGI